MAIKFLTANDVQKNGVSLDHKATSPSDPERLGFLTTLVIDRFMEQVKWDDITEMYLTGLVTDEDMSIIKRAVGALASGGVEYV